MLDDGNHQAQSEAANSEPLRNAVYRLYMAESRPGREVAEILGISIAKVYRLLRAYRIPRRPTGSGSVKITAERRAEMQLASPDGICMSVRADGRRCTNWKVPGFRYCWIHLEDFDRRKAAQNGHNKGRTAKGLR